MNLIQYVNWWWKMNKNVDGILCKLCDLVNNGDDRTSINIIFEKVFEEKNQIELLLKRAIVIEHCQRVLKQLDYPEDHFEDIYKVLCFHNLSLPKTSISQFLTKTHKRMIQSTFALHRTIKKIHEVDDLVQVSNELKSCIEDENLTQSEKILMYEICESVENAKKEHDIVGNSAIKKLHEILIGKFFLYKDQIKNIKSQKIKEKLFNVYKKTEEVNKVLGFLISLKDNVGTILELFR